jgi:S1-C subfamily serine protease
MVACSLAAGIGLAMVQSAGSQTTREVAQGAFPSVVSLVVHFDPTSRTYDSGFVIRTMVRVGSGFFVKEDVVATNAHVVKGALGGHARSVVGERAAHDIEGILAIDEERDLALVKVSTLKARALPLADASQVAVGDEVYAVGSPQGLEGTFSPGIVSGLRNWKTGRLLQITAPISPGSSGGPILNRRGEVVGVAVGVLSEGQNLNFAVSVGHLRALLDRPVRWTGWTKLPQGLAMPTMPQATPGALPAPAVKSLADREDVSRPDPSVEVRKDFHRHLKALAEQAEALSALLGPPLAREEYLPVFREFETRWHALRARLPGQTPTTDLTTLLRACDRLVAAEETWKREVASVPIIASRRSALEAAQTEHVRRRSMVTKIEQDIAEESLRTAERDRDRLVKDRLVHWEAAAHTLKSPDSASKP